MSSIVGVLAVIVGGGLVWLLFGSGKPGRRPSTGKTVAADYDQLEQAEAEVRGLDVFTSPEDADDEIPDWGPGAPKPPG